MTNGEIIARLRAEQPALKEAGVDRRFLFGSMACSEAEAASDIRLHFEHENGAIGLFALMELRERVHALVARQPTG